MAGGPNKFRAEEMSDKWMSDANCKGLTFLFFDHPGERPQARDRREAEAKAICNECVVIVECRDYARANYELGIWGGENEEERRIARRHTRQIS